jgi:hypothetical protein
MNLIDILKGIGLGIVIWFFSALFFGILVEAAVPTRAEHLREMASAAFFPMAMVGSLVLVRQGHAKLLTRFSAVLALGGLLWFVLAATVGFLLVRADLHEAGGPLMSALSAGSLVVSVVASWRIVPGGLGSEEPAVMEHRSRRERPEAPRLES